MTPLLDVRGLHVRIALEGGEIHALRGIDLSVARGEMLCVVGESGSGKSMTALSIMDLLPRKAARRAESLRFDGQDLAALSPRAMADLRGNRIGMIFQEPMTSLNPAYSIGNQLMEVYRRHRPASEADARRRAGDLLQLVGISNPGVRMAQYPHQLSGGLRQRVMIAMALMCEPDLLIADEPTSALDVTIQVQILTLLQQLRRELGIAVILITHDLGVVARVADRVAVMYAGQILETGTRRDVFTAPRHPYTQGLLDSIPVPGSAHARLHAIPGTVPSLNRPIPGCAFAPRCHRAAPRCETTTIPLVAEAAHGYRCLFPNPPSAQDIGAPP